jgi:predicted DNA-binding WGR domain protein
MPSYWSLSHGASRLDVGLSGWTQNDWSRAAQFDLLASLGAPSAEHLRLAAAMLEDRLVVTPEEVALGTGLDRAQATSALQGLCREGRALYDYTAGTYRWRRLFPFMPQPEAVHADPRLAAARRLLERRAVTWSAPPQRNAPATLPPAGAPAGWRTFTYKDAKSDKFWNILLTGTSHVVHFGRTGTDGQRQQKEFATAEAARASYDKLVKEKTGKGYRETMPSPAPPPVAPAAGQVAPTGERTRYTADVKGERNVYHVVLDVDADGRVVYAQCTCGTYRRDKLRKGPCAHILAVTVAAARSAGNVVAAVSVSTTDG